MKEPELTAQANTTKVCRGKGSCGIEKPISAFPKWRHNRRVYIKSLCSNCCSKRYRARYPKKVKEISRRAKSKYVQCNSERRCSLFEYIGQSKCLSCGFTDQRALCFHHRVPSEKSFAIKFGLTHSYSMSKLRAEARKCDVLCANCHALHHYLGDECAHPESRKKAADAAKLKAQLLRSINQESCQQCGTSSLPVLSFHHREAEKKKFILSEAIYRKRPFDELLAEAQKCMVLCLNCHFITHEKLRGRR